MEILIENLQNKFELKDEIKDLIHKAVEASFDYEGFDTPSEVSVLLVDDEEIRRINCEQRQIDSATDVLSFPMVEMKEGSIISNDGDYDLDENLLLLGDIVISMEMVKKQAEEYGHSFERELAFLVTHGMYHLLGYDHETEEDENVMLGRQEAVLEKMGLKRA